MSKKKANTSKTAKAVLKAVHQLLDDVTVFRNAVDVWREGEKEIVTKSIFRHVSDISALLMRELQEGELSAPSKLLWDLSPFGADGRAYSAWNDHDVQDLVNLLLPVLGGIVAKHAIPQEDVKRQTKHEREVTRQVLDEATLSEAICRAPILNRILENTSQTRDPDKPLSPTPMKKAAIPVEFRTLAMSMSDAAERLGYTTSKKNRDAGRKQVEREIANGSLNADRTSSKGRKFYFDKRQVRGD